MNAPDLLTPAEIAEAWGVHKRTVRRTVIAAGLQPEDFTGITPLYSSEQVGRLLQRRKQSKLQMHRRRVEIGRAAAMKRHHGIPMADQIITVAEAKRRAGRGRK